MASRGDRPNPPGRRRKPRRSRRPKRKPPAGPAAAVAAEPTIDTRKPAEEPLSPREQAEMREHLRFLARHRKTLRLKLNAKEDLLINGARAPEHRGVCMHLLGKVDHACVKAALARVDSAEKRTALLDGVVRFSSDVTVLLLYLEALQQSESREEASRALGVALRKLDFGTLSPAQMQRVLDLAAGAFGDRELPQVVLGLLQNRGFRSTFDQSAERLPERLTALYLPVRAAHSVVFEGKPGDPNDAALGTGLDLLLSAPKKTLRAHPEAARRRLFEIALGKTPASPALDDALDALVDSFAKESRTFSALATLLASRSLRLHRDDHARELLEKVRQHHPGLELVPRYLEALAAPRLDRIALLPEREPRGRRRGSRPLLQPGMWLDAQRRLWVCIGRPEDSERFDAAVAMHSRAVLPGIAPLLLAGRGPASEPYLAVAGVGTPIAHGWRRLRLDAGATRDLAVAGVEILAALALAGVAIPDVSPRRFLLQGTERMWIWNLIDAAEVASDEASRSHLSLARNWVGDLLCRVPPGQLPPKLMRAVRDAADLPALARALVALG